MDFTELTREALGQVQDTKPAAQINADTIAKISSIVAQQVRADLRREQAHQQKVSHQKISRANEVRGFVKQQIEKISATAALIQLHKNGVKLSDETVGKLPELAKQAMVSADALADAVAEGDAAETDLLEALIEGASEDPDAAAALAEQAGDSMSPEEVENAAVMLAEAIMDEEMGNGETKESMQKKSSLSAFAKQSSPITNAVVRRRAEKLIQYAIMSQQG